MKHYYRLFIMVGLLFGFTAVSQAQTIPSSDLEGFAWSSNIGWISLNCKTGSATGGNHCSASNYKVTINSDRTISGWAWSSNVGWIKFGGLSGFPAGAGTVTDNAKVSGTYPNLTWTGWARACAGTADLRCGAMAYHPNGGGWDGWIALKTNTSSVSANMDTGKMNTNSYAWGSHVVGWIDMFSHVSFASKTTILGGKGCSIPNGASSCTGNLNWNFATGVTSPNVFNTGNNTIVSTALNSTGQSVTLPFGTTNFLARSDITRLATLGLEAVCEGNLKWNGTVCAPEASIKPVITLKVTPVFVRAGNRAQVEWTVSPLTGSTCTLYAPGIANNGNNSMPVTTATGNRQTGAINNTTTVRLTCTAAYGTVEEKVVIEVIPVAEEV